MDRPKCLHDRKGIVTSGPWNALEAHAAADVCGERECIEDAMRWVNSFTNSSKAHYIADRPKVGA